MQKNRIARQHVFWLVLPLLFLWACAEVGSISGGPRDEEPPVFLGSEPPMNATNFAEAEIVLEFDEYVQLNKLNEQLVISPPLVEEKPIFKMKGKKLVIDLNNELKDSATYNLNFKNAIQDLNEGNPLENFQFVFSTGDKIDSLHVRGNLREAFTLENLLGMYVVLYAEHNDSVPYNQVPDFVAKTDSSGNFDIPNVKAGTYKIFALNDINFTFKFDLPSEEIAFSDSLFTPYAESAQQVDTLKIDSVSIDKETGDTLRVEKDSVVHKTVTEFFPNDIQLFMFKEDNEKQYLLEYDRKMPGMCHFFFNRRLNENFKLRPLSFPADSSWFLPEKNETRDSIYIWIPDSAIYNLDTLKLELNYSKHDTDGVLRPTLDTLQMVFRPKKTKDKKSKKAQPLAASYNLAGGVLDANKLLKITFSQPLARIDTSKIKLYELRDTSFTEIKDTLEVEKKETLEIPLTFDLLKDSLHLRRFVAKADFESGKRYRFFADTATFFDIFENTQDTLDQKFTVREEDHYGRILLSLAGVEKNSVLQLRIPEKGLVREHFIESDTTFQIDYLNPKKYQLKLFFDENNNKKWDTGDYMKHRQPETMFVYPKEIEIRSNFDTEITWKLER